VANASASNREAASGVLAIGMGGDRQWERDPDDRILRAAVGGPEVLALH
jgi:hypothetical protein